MDRTLERQQSFERTLADEQRAFREMELLQEMQQQEHQDKILYFEDSRGVNIVSYNDYEKETIIRDAEGLEQLEIQELTIDDKNELDAMHYFAEEYEHEETNMDDVDIPRFEPEEPDLGDLFERDEEDDIDREEMEYD